MKEKFESKRISKTAEILVNAGIEKSFPLFTPIGEKVWADGWDPEIIWLPEKLIAEHMVFKTEPSDLFKGRESEYVWTVSKYSPEEYFVEYTVFTPERLWNITVICKKAMEEKTAVSVTYSFTGLNEEGNSKNRFHLEGMYSENLKDWERAINQYLETGEMLKH